MRTTRWIAAGLVAAAVGWWASASAPAQPAKQPRQVQFDDDDLDVPDFLK